MIHNLLRRPEGAGMIFADLVRLLALLSVPAAGIWFDTTAIAAMATTFVGMFAPRVLGLRAGFDVAFGITLLVAGWSSVLELYITVPGWDLFIHCVLNGMIAAVTYLVVAWFDIVRPVATDRLYAITINVSAYGLALGAVWEILEWAGHTFMDPAIFVAYEDSISDLAAGLLGSFIAGLLMKVIAAKAHQPAVAA